MGAVAKNAAFMTLASIGQKIVAFLYFTLVARNLGVEHTGLYTFALSFTTIFVAFVDLGLTNVLIREAAKVPEKLSVYLGTVLRIKMILGVLAYGAMVLTLFLLKRDNVTMTLVLLSGVTMLFDSLHLTLYGALRSIGHLRHEALGIVSSQIITLVLGSLALWLKLPLFFIILAFTIPSILNALYAFLVLRFYYHVPISFAGVRTESRPFIRMAVPFGFSAIAARFYSYFDTILVSLLLGNAALGLYSVPYKVTYAFQFIPLALVAALYPRLAEHYGKGEKEELSHLVVSSIKYVLLTVVPIAIGVSVIAPIVLGQVYGVVYLESVLPLRILLVGLIFSFVSFPLGAALNATNRQTLQTILVTCMLFLNVLINIYAIPQFGVPGAAVAALIGNGLLAIIGYIIVARIMPLPHRLLARFGLGVMVCGIVMGAIVFWLMVHVHLIVGIAVGVLVYPLLLLSTRTITKGDMMMAKRLFSKKTV